ncbi:RNA polymerase sigma factor [Evansella vedderi]|uniref:RNA polymerase sigma factor SigI n=1 Tax=Evansella vedderi TaxID=38282 RepID=A0ABT9ZYP3_9BACI|nr:RNA polymerase sigma-I factor [Evansella vedderi]MDQ0255235.1 RNA polymerase sigma factor [Evansella vedderi]
MLKRLKILNREELSIEETIRLIQQGDGESEIENQLIQKYIPFIQNTATKVCKRYIRTSDDDEFSIALIAFNEAIHNYSENKGSSFLSFASLVIRRRIIDYIRQEQRKKVSLSIDYVDTDKENMENIAEVKASFKEFEQRRETEYRREEIFHLQEQLAVYGITLAEVSEQSPKHQDARENMLMIAKTIIQNPELKEFLIEKKRLPMKALTKSITMSRKTIERNRKYIITLCIVLMEDYRYLQDYLKEWTS